MPLGAELIGRAVAQRCRRGLYAKRQVQFGNKVSEDGGNRTRRKWLPNAHRKRLFSEQLETFVSFQVTAGALRNIDKAGGLDNYVRKVKGTKEDSQGAFDIRLRLGDEKGLQEQQKAEKQRERGRRRIIEQQRKMLNLQRRWTEAELAKAERLGKNADKAAQSGDGQKPDASTIGWIRNKLGSGFKWQ